MQLKSALNPDMAESIGLALSALMLNNAPVTEDVQPPRFGWDEMLQRIADELHLLEDSHPFITPIFELYASLHDPLEVDFMSPHGWRRLCEDIGAGHDLGQSRATASAMSDVIFREVAQDRMSGLREVRLIFPSFLLALARLGVSQLLGAPEHLLGGSSHSRHSFTPQDVEDGVQRITAALENARAIQHPGDASELLEPDVVTELRSSQQVLQRIFYYSCDRSTCTLSWDETLDLAKAFNLVPGLLSKVALFSLFRAISPERHPLTFPGYIELLGRVALQGFSSAGLSEVYPRAGDKIKGLLERMRAAPRLAEFEAEEDARGGSSGASMMTPQQLAGIRTERQSASLSNILPESAESNVAAVLAKRHSTVGGYKGGSGRVNTGSTVGGGQESLTSENTHNNLGLHASAPAQSLQVQASRSLDLSAWGSIGQSTTPVHHGGVGGMVYSGGGKHPPRNPIHNGIARLPKSAAGQAGEAGDVLTPLARDRHAAQSWEQPKQAPPQAVATNVEAQSDVASSVTSPHRERSVQFVWGEEDEGEDEEVQGGSISSPLHRADAPPAALKTAPVQRRAPPVAPAAPLAPPSVADDTPAADVAVAVPANMPGDGAVSSTHHGIPVSMPGYTPVHSTVDGPASEPMQMTNASWAGEGASGTATTGTWPASAVSLSQLAGMDDDMRSQASADGSISDSMGGAAVRLDDAFPQGSPPLSAVEPPLNGQHIDAGPSSATGAATGAAGASVADLLAASSHNSSVPELSFQKEGTVVVSRNRGDRRIRAVSGGASVVDGAKSVRSGHTAGTRATGRTSLVSGATSTGIIWTKRYAKAGAHKEGSAGGEVDSVTGEPLDGGSVSGASRLPEWATPDHPLTPGKARLLAAAVQGASAMNNAGASTSSAEVRRKWQTQWAPLDISERHATALLRKAAAMENAEADAQRKAGKWQRNAEKVAASTTGRAAQGEGGASVAGSQAGGGTGGLKSALETAKPSHAPSVSEDILLNLKIQLKPEFLPDVRPVFQFYVRLNSRSAQYATYSQFVALLRDMSVFDDFVTPSAVHLQLLATTAGRASSAKRKGEFARTVRLAQRFRRRSRIARQALATTPEAGGAGVEGGTTASFPTLSPAALAEHDASPTVGFGGASGPGTPMSAGVRFQSTPRGAGHGPSSSPMGGALEQKGSISSVPGGLGGTGGSVMTAGSAASSATVSRSGMGASSHEGGPLPKGCLDLPAFFEALLRVSELTRREAKHVASAEADKSATVRARGDSKSVATYSTRYSGGGGQAAPGAGSVMSAADELTHELDGASVHARHFLMRRVIPLGEAVLAEDEMLQDIHTPAVCKVLQDNESFLALVYQYYTDHPTATSQVPRGHKQAGRRGRGGGRSQRGRKGGGSSGRGTIGKAAGNAMPAPNSVMQSHQFAEFAKEWEMTPKLLSTQDALGLFHTAARRAGTDASTLTEQARAVAAAKRAAEAAAGALTTNELEEDERRNVMDDHAVDRSASRRRSLILGGADNPDTPSSKRSSLQGAADGMKGVALWSRVRAAVDSGEIAAQNSSEAADDELDDAELRASGVGAAGTLLGTLMRGDGSMLRRRGGIDAEATLIRKRFKETILGESADASAAAMAVHGSYHGGVDSSYINFPAFVEAVAMAGLQGFSRAWLVEEFPTPLDRVVGVFTWMQASGNASRIASAEWARGRPRAGDPRLKAQLRRAIDKWTGREPVAKPAAARDALAATQPPRRSPTASPLLRARGSPGNSPHQGDFQFTDDSEGALHVDISAEEQEHDAFASYSVQELIAMAETGQLPTAEQLREMRATADVAREQRKAMVRQLYPSDHQSQCETESKAGSAVDDGPVHSQFQVQPPLFRERPVDNIAQHLAQDRAKKEASAASMRRELPAPVRHTSMSPHYVTTSVRFHDDDGRHAMEAGGMHTALVNVDSPGGAEMIHFPPARTVDTLSPVTTPSTAHMRSLSSASSWTHTLTPDSRYSVGAHSIKGTMASVHGGQTASVEVSVKASPPSHAQSPGSALREPHSKPVTTTLSPGEIGHLKRMNAALAGRHIRSYVDDVRSHKGQTIQRLKTLQGLTASAAVVPMEALGGQRAMYGESNLAGVRDIEDNLLGAGEEAVETALQSPPSARDLTARGSGRHPRVVHGSAEIGARARLGRSGLLPTDAHAASAGGVQGGSAANLDMSQLSAITSRSDGQHQRAGDAGEAWNVSMASVRSQGGHGGGYQQPAKAAHPARSARQDALMMLTAFTHQR